MKIISFLCFALLTFQVIAKTPGEIDVGGYLREATLKGLNTKDSSFKDYIGKPLIINIWASWCGPCRSEMGSLEHLAKQYNTKELNIIGISTDDYPKKAKAFIKESKVTFNNYIDSHLFLENMLGANRIPLTLLVDKNGKVLKKVNGAYEWDHPEIIEAIADVFKIKLNIIAK